MGVRDSGKGGWVHVLEASWSWSRTRNQLETDNEVTRVGAGRSSLGYDEFTQRSEFEGEQVTLNVGAKELRDHSVQTRRR